MTPRINIRFVFGGPFRGKGITETHQWSSFSKTGALFWTPWVGRVTVNMTTGRITGVRNGWQASDEDLVRLRALRDRGHVLCVYGDWSVTETRPAAFYVHAPYGTPEPGLRKAIRNKIQTDSASKAVSWWYMPAHVDELGYMHDYAASNVFPHFRYVDGALVSM